MSCFDEFQKNFLLVIFLLDSEFDVAPLDVSPDEFSMMIEQTF